MPEPVAVAQPVAEAPAAEEPQPENANTWKSMLWR